MRRLVLHLAAGAVALFLGASAQAGPLTSASVTFNLGGAGDIVFPGTGVTGTAMSLTQATVDAGSGFAGTVTTPLDASPATGLEVVIGSNTLGNLMGDPLTSTNFLIGLTSTITGFGGTPLITVPLAAGSTDDVTINEGGVTVNIFPEGWTSGVLALTDGSGGAVATITGDVVQGEPGSIRLVSGAYITTSLADPTYVTIAVDMEFESVPEPTMVLLFGAGAVVLGGFAWRKRQA
ncbi:MAG: PEP-CTERM sorting domain-containing protein [Myxococcota bacterium]